jgi:ferritin-like protein
MSEREEHNSMEYIISRLVDLQVDLDNAEKKYHDTIAENKPHLEIGEDIEKIKRKLLFLVRWIDSKKSR